MGRIFTNFFTKSIQIQGETTVTEIYRIYPDTPHLKNQVFQLATEIGPR